MINYIQYKSVTTRNEDNAARFKEDVHLCGVERPGNAKVRNLGCAIRAEKKISRLDITMHDVQVLVQEEQPS